MKSLPKILIAVVFAVIGNLFSFFILRLPITVSFILGGICGGAAIVLIERIMQPSPIGETPNSILDRIRGKGKIPAKL